MPADISIKQFTAWLPKAKVYLVCPFDDKEEAKQLGAKWEPNSKKWYITEDMNTSRFAKWLPQSTQPPLEASPEKKSADDAGDGTDANGTENHLTADDDSEV